MATEEFYESHLSDLIAHLYDAAMDTALWPGTASRIAEVFGSTSTVLKLQAGDAQVTLLECTDNLVVSAQQQAWAEDWHRKDLWVERSVAYGMSRIVTDEDLVAREEQRQSGFYQEWLRYLGIHHMLGAIFPTSDGAMGVLGIHRAQAAGAYNALERRQAALLLPHLQRALRLGQRLASTSITQQAGVQVLNCLDAGVLVVDGFCRVIYANEGAEAILRENREIVITGGYVLIRDPVLHDGLRTRVRDAVNTAQGKVARLGAAFAVPREHRLPLAVEVSPLRPSTLPFAGQRPYALVFIRDPETPIAVKRLRNLFGLTHTEGAIATELASGRSLKEIASRLGIGMATVRSHLKNILAKTSTHRQAELVALLARSISMILDD